MIANIWVCIADFFSIILANHQHTKRHQFHIFKKCKIDSVRQSRQVQFLQWCHSMVNVSLQTLFFTFLIFAKVWLVQTKVTHWQTHIHTHTHRNRQAHSYREILQICLKTMKIKWNEFSLFQHCKQFYAANSDKEQRDKKGNSAIFKEPACRHQWHQPTSYHER